MASALAMSLAGCGGIPVDDPTHPSRSLDHALAMYGVGNATDAAEARDGGASIVVLPWATASRSYLQKVEAMGMGILDSSVKNFVYRTQCPNGHDSCHALTDGEINELATQVRLHVAETRIVPAVSGYYILDDNYTDMSVALSSVAEIIHAADPNRPTVCPFNLPLVANGSDPSYALSVFERSLRNYSPEWCDRVAIYAYVQPRSLAATEAVDWEMQSILPRALDALRASGWDSMASPLIGVPQAFGYSERGPMDKHRPAPAKEELRNQVRAFCRSGATTILAYIWNSRARARDVLELHNSPELRAGLRQGMGDCSTSFWS